VDQSKPKNKPHKKKVKKPSKIAQNNLPLVEGKNKFCICKGPDDGIRPMVQCDYCEDWFHFDCVGITQVL
jgi:hypothetical protein